MRIPEQEVPFDEVEEPLNEMREEIKILKNWYKKSQKSLDLIVESTKRVLTEKEASQIAGDFLEIGILAGEMGMRQEMVLKTADTHIASSMSGEVIKRIEDMLKKKE